MDVGLSLARRPGLEHRALIVGESRKDLLHGLSALADDGMAGNVLKGVAGEHGGGEIAFLFTGQGAQRVGMGCGLYDRFPVFRHAFDGVCERLDVLLGRSLREVVFGVGDLGPADGLEGLREVAGGGPELGLLDRTLFTQAGLFALEVALFRLVEGFGVRPDYLVGHSIGELVAAYVGGVLSLDDACTLVAARGRLMGALPEGGAMVAVQASEREVVASLAGYEDRVALAAVNGPLSVVLSGEQDAVEELAEIWTRQGRKVKSLTVSHAFHSSRMDGMLEEFAEVAEGISFSEPVIPIVSNVSGRVDPEMLSSPGYWVRHVRDTVRFTDGIHWLRSRGVTSFLELGPDGVLSGMVAECAEEEPVGVEGATASFATTEHERSDGVTPLPGADCAVMAAPVLRDGRAEDSALLDALGRLWASGTDVAWGSVFEGSGAERVELPTYAFQREHYWLQPTRIGAGDAVSLGQASAEHPLLGAAVVLADGRGWLFTGRISLQSHPWLADHMVGGVVLLPGTALLELALRAGSEVECGVVEELIQEAPLVLPEHGGVRLQVTVGELDQGARRSFEIYSRRDVA